MFQRSRPDAPASFAQGSEGELRVGFAQALITPERDLYMGGFTIGKTAEGVHSELAARAMVLAWGDRKLAIVGIDNLGLMREDVEWIKDGLPGFANGDVFLCASHTHAAPDLIGLWGFYFLASGRDEDYLVQVRDGVRRAVAEAAAGLVPATLHAGEARLPREGLIDNSNRRGVFNPRATVLAARHRETGVELGALLHLACHPEMMRRRNRQISADFVGEVCDRWRAAGHGQAVFVNGELGAMITPRHRPSGAEGIPVAGGKFLAVFERALAAATPLDGGAVEVRRRDVYLPLETPGLTFGRLTGVIRRELFDGAVRVSVGWLRIGAFEAACVPGELEPVFAEEIRRALRRPSLVFFGLCDDEVGYLLRAVDARDPEFAYERSMSPAADSGERIRAALVR